ncbi:hypothetical protein [Amycolatopsis sp. H20-H5]|uniref:hypothetical protein n=1 Tax=Amycolatopsis sp. H20-H5 TaxID=3046309 RepID=UPI002DB7F693|nr:hypothetical protein [Amycolatopsis sp. H20-H5]MEC3979885.1 hypothetical protein [Amycolatopsis sp. H20-H5]
MAATVAGRMVVGLYNLVKEKFASDPDASAVLEAAEGAAQDSPQVLTLAEALEAKRAEDPVFDEQVGAEWERATIEQHADSGGVTNQVSGQVSGKVLQARDIQGGVTF